jgi:hypothetical protein
MVRRLPDVDRQIPHDHVIVVENLAVAFFAEQPPYLREPFPDQRRDVLERERTAKVDDGAPCLACPHLRLLLLFGLDLQGEYRGKIMLSCRMGVLPMANSGERPGSTLD